jgi:hypothetical protein
MSLAIARAMPYMCYPFYTEHWQSSGSGGADFCMPSAQLIPPANRVSAPPFLKVPNKTGTGSEPVLCNSAENDRCEVPVPALLGTHRA